jgi:phosphoribosylglycinamide formyltransferase-1
LSANELRQPIVVLISGRGGNMRALVERSSDAAMGYRVAGVLSDHAGAAGLLKAAELGIPAQALESDKGITRADYDRALAGAIDVYEPRLIVLAGFMRILSAEFVERYAGRILNIHPSLLPKYPGLHTHQRVIDAGDPEHGATVHFVTEELDGGPAVIQAKLEVSSGDDAGSLALRVQTLEHRIYPLAVRWFCTGRLRVCGGRAWLDGAALAGPVQYDAIKEQ